MYWDEEASTWTFMNSSAKAELATKRVDTAMRRIERVFTGWFLVQGIERAVGRVASGG
jgi:hypothetical protein